MTGYQAPAKLNLALHVESPRSDGYHPLVSLVQTIEWCDRLEVDEGEGDDALTVEGAELEPEGNLVLKAVSAVRAKGRVRPLAMTLHKTIPVAAGLGGGSSDAAAGLVAAVEAGGLAVSVADEVAPSVGADVPLFLTGGSLLMSGVGEVIDPVDPLDGFAVAVVVPEFGLSTVEVYRRWDEMEGPVGDVVPDSDLPPTLRDEMPMRNDLLPAGLDLEPRLGDFLSDVRSVWGTTVSLTGSGSACFGYFGTVEEAIDAAGAVEGSCRVARGVELRPHGVHKTVS